jgi:hypothetical protein
MIAIQTESARQSRQRERGAAVEPALVERWPGDPVAAGRGPQSPQHSANMSQGACRARAVLPYTCRPLRSQGRGASRCAPRAAVRLSLRRRLCHGRCGRGHSRGRCGRRECPVSPRLLLWTAGVMVSTLVLRMTACRRAFETCASTSVACAGAEPNERLPRESQPDGRTERCSVLCLTASAPVRQVELWPA